MARIAVVGSGISGLASAWILSQEHEVTLYEKNQYLGGHTNTRPAQFGEETVLADTGFMVFNYETYPHLVAMFKYLEIEIIDTDMSFGVSARDGEFEFHSDYPFGNVRRVCSPAHWRMLFEIARFNRTVKEYLSDKPDDISLGEVLAGMRLSRYYQDNFLLPMAGAIWSTDKVKIKEYPAKEFVAFFENHGLLTPTTLNPFSSEAGRLKWYTVKGGAQTYVEKIKSKIQADIRPSCEVNRVERTETEIVVHDVKGEKQVFDQIVCAGRPDQFLALLDTPSAVEQEALGAFSFSTNEVYMHKDSSCMIRSTSDWPSWTYTETGRGEVELSYNMNKLQSIDPQYPVFVTLNPVREIAPEDTFYRTTYTHPLFSAATKRAQAVLASLQGEHNTWYAGAWLGHGFHEDGLRSAVAVGQGFGLTPPWVQ